MEPLTALGLAGNVVQFIDFGFKLVGTATEIAGSAKGATESTLELDKIYKTLKTFATKLESLESGPDLDTVDGAGSLPRALAVSREIEAHTVALKAIAVDSRIVCDQLLSVVDGLRVKEGTSGRRIKSIGMAIKMAFKEKKLAGLEERLKRFQALISLHFFPLLEQKQDCITFALSGLRDQSHRMKLEHTAKLDEIAKSLNDVSQKIQFMPHEQIQDRHDTKRNQTPGHINRRDSCYPVDVDALEEILSNLTLVEKDLKAAAREQILLQRLNFESRPYRHENIPAAHEATFGWILPNPTSAAEGNAEMRSRFGTWLKHGNGTFWVTGKAGAGKSTLIKFIASHSQTRNALAGWAGTKKIVLAAHYFWSAGTPMQKSLNGLLRALLYDIMCSCPEQAPEIFPSQWRYTETTPPSAESRSGKHWSTQELCEALRTLARHPSLPVRCCLFIDGLDEFDGDHVELCQLLGELSQSSNIKSCVSSRPWNVFEDAFSGDKSTKLCVHDLTFHDIRKYTESRLKEHPSWKHACVTEEESARFIFDITERAQGVFLWVYLVTKSLRDGLVNGDTIDDLQTRLEVIPTDLEPFFKHMLDLVAPIYHRYMSRTLQMTITAKEPLHLMTYYAAEYEERCNNYALERPWEPDLVLAHLPTNLLKPCRRRINARCGGLLGFKKNRVEFLHRTVHDFLLTGPMHDYLQEKTGGPGGFDVNTSLLKALAFQFRCVLAAPSSLENVENAKALWKECLRYANEALAEDEEGGLLVLDTIAEVHQDNTLKNVLSVRHMLERVYRDGEAGGGASTTSHTVRSSQNHPIADDHKPLSFYMRDTFLEAGVHRYVLHKARRNLQHFHTDRNSPLTKILKLGSWDEGHANIISGLLDLGCDPNERLDSGDGNNSGNTIWIKFLREDKSWDDMVKLYRRDNSILSMFLRKGAHRTTCRIGYGSFKILPLTYVVLIFLQRDYAHWFLEKPLSLVADFFMVGKSNSSQEDQSTLQKLQLQDLLVPLSFYLKRFGRGRANYGKPIPTPAAKRLLAKVLEKIIAQGNELKMDMVYLVPGIRSYFGESEATLLLLAMIPGAKPVTGEPVDPETTNYESTGAKKRRQDNNSSGRSGQEAERTSSLKSPKRIKLEKSPVAGYKVIQEGGKEVVMID